MKFQFIKGTTFEKELGNIQKYQCDFDGCFYSSNFKLNVKRHKQNIHNIDVVWHYCEQEGCNYKSKSSSHVKIHKTFVHDVNVKWHYCDQEGCNFKAKEASGIKTHKSNIHNINVVWYHCDQEGCNSKSKTAGGLKEHKAHIHDIDVTWYHCDHEGCTFKTKSARNLKEHKANVHDIDVVWYHCDQEGCEYKCKFAGALKSHQANIHDINVVWYHCDQEGCEYKCKSGPNLKNHKSNIHDINVVWYHCDQEGCEYKCKIAGHLKEHKANIHDIGDHLCDFCVRNRNSSIEYVDQHNNKSNICRECFNKATGKNSRIEIIWSDYLDKHLGTIGLLSSDKSLRSQGGCSRYRPDKIYIYERIVEIGECDEHQHIGSSYSCDERRLSEIYEEDGIQGKFMYVMRWNPDSYFPENGIKKTRYERLEIYLALAKKLRLLEHLDKIHIYYLFYSFDNENITQNLPYTHIHSMEDVENLV